MNILDKSGAFIAQIDSIQVVKGFEVSQILVYLLGHTGCVVFYLCVLAVYDVEEHLKSCDWASFHQAIR